MSRLTRDGTAEPVSRDQILRHARGQANIIFPVQLTTSRIGNLTRLIHTLLYVMTIHTYIIGRGIRVLQLRNHSTPSYCTSLHRQRHLNAKCPLYRYQLACPGPRTTFSRKVQGSPPLVLMLLKKKGQVNSLNGRGGWREESILDHQCRLVESFDKVLRYRRVTLTDGRAKSRVFDSEIIDTSYFLSFELLEF